MSAAAPGAPEKGATVERAPGLMFDPSSLLHQAALAQVVELARETGAGHPLFVAASFIRALNEPDLLPSVLRYFGRRVEQTSPQDILAMTRAAGLQVYTAAPAPSRQQDPIAERLIRQRDRGVRDILLEEWSFLTGQSWVAARTKKAFDAFRRAGAIVMDFSGQKLDGVVARTLRHDRLPAPPALTQRDRLRAAAKWVAAGGAPVLPLVDPILGAAAGAGIGVFFLFDP